MKTVTDVGNHITLRFLGSWIQVLLPWESEAASLRKKKALVFSRYVVNMHGRAATKSVLGTFFFQQGSHIHLGEAERIKRHSLAGALSSPVFSHQKAGNEDI